MSDFETELWDLDFGVAKSMRYHASRRAFFAGLDRATKALSAIFGTSALVAFMGDHGTLAKLSAAAVAIAGSLDLVFNFSARERHHDDLYRDFCELSVQIAELAIPTAQDVKQIRAKRLRIEADEPTVIDLLERRCSAEECISRGCPVQPEWKLTALEASFTQVAVGPLALLLGWFYAREGKRSATSPDKAA